MAEEAAQIADREMIERIGRGDQSAFSALYDRLSRPLYSLALRMLGETGDARDAVHDGCLQIWSRAATYNPEQSTVFSWTVLLTRSRVIDRLRARKRRLRIVDNGTGDEDADVADASTMETGADTA